MLSCKISPLCYHWAKVCERKAIRIIIVALQRCTKGLRVCNLHQKRTTKSRFINYLLLITLKIYRKTSILYICSVHRAVKFKFLWYCLLTKCQETFFLCHCMLFLAFSHDVTIGFYFSYHFTMRK